MDFASAARERLFFYEKGGLFLFPGMAIVFCTFGFLTGIHLVFLKTNAVNF
jgi:hypothetical protein